MDDIYRYMFIIDASSIGHMARLT